VSKIGNPLMILPIKKGINLLNCKLLERQPFIKDKVGSEIRLPKRVAYILLKEPLRDVRELCLLKSVEMKD